LRACNLLSGAMLARDCRAGCLLLSSEMPELPSWLGTGLLILAVAAGLLAHAALSMLLGRLKEDKLEPRVLFSAANSGNAWDLRCHLREEVVKFLAAHYPAALPRARIQIIWAGEGLAGGRNPRSAAAD
jgi:hypothetical protein